MCKHFVYKVEVRIGIIEVLGNRLISTGTHFIDKVTQIRLIVRRLGMHLWIGGHNKLEAIPRFTADKLDQFVSIAKFT